MVSELAEGTELLIRRMQYSAYRGFESLPSRGHIRQIRCSLVFQYLKPSVGIEPTTVALQIRCSTSELRKLNKVPDKGLITYTGVFRLTHLLEYGASNRYTPIVPPIWHLKKLILTHLKLHLLVVALVDKVLVELVSKSYRFFAPSMYIITDIICGYIFVLG